MLDCIKKIIKRGKRRADHKKPKTPWELSQPGLFKTHHSFIREYDYETYDAVKGKHFKFPK